MMIVAVVGSRDFPNALRVVRTYVEKIAAKYPDAVIVSGGARGVDMAAETTALLRGLGVVSYRPVKTRAGRYQYQRYEMKRGVGRKIDAPSGDFTSYGQAAFARNRLIVEAADVVVAFQVNGSRGTQNSIDIARELGKPTYVYAA